MNPFRLSIAFLLLATTLPAFAAPIERELSLTLSVDGSQSWRNGKQWSKSTTQQRYEISTRLVSDGRLYVDNLLDADRERRMRIKSEFYTYRGLVELKREFAGRLPSYAEVSHRVSGESAEVLQARARCVDAADCPSVVAERFSAITALQHNTPAELDDFIASYDEPGGRYMVFSGSAGCANRMRLTQRSHFAGEQAYDRDKKKLQAFTLDWTADSQGNAVDQRNLCERYVAVIDTASGQLHLENAYMPLLRGKVVQVIAGVSRQSEADLPVPYEVMRWVNEHLAQAAESGRRNTTLRLTRPLDGNATVLGEFDGSAQVDLSWSFKKLVAAPTAR